MKFLSPTIPDIESFLSLMDPSSQWHVAWAYFHDKIVKKTMHILVTAISKLSLFLNPSFQTIVGS